MAIKQQGVRKMWAGAGSRTFSHETWKQVNSAVEAE
jgi:uncharacterized protein YukE